MSGHLDGRFSSIRFLGRQADHVIAETQAAEPLLGSGTQPPADRTRRRIHLDAQNLFDEQGDGPQPRKPHKVPLGDLARIYGLQIA